jgi:uncharacterized protein with von Willebrand factor type A (vWA) domain
MPQRYRPRRRLIGGSNPRRSDTPNFVADLLPRVHDDGAGLPDAAGDYTPPPPPVVRAVGGGVYDDYAFDRAVGEMPNLSAALDAAQTDLPTRLEHAGKKTMSQGEALARDLFSMFYRMEPELQEVAPEFALNRKALEELRDTEEYARLHQLAQLDPFSAALGSATYTEKLSEVVKQQQEQHPPQAGDPQGQPGGGGSQGTGGQQGGGQNPQGGDQQGQPDPNDQAARQALRVAARQAAQAAEAAISAAQDAIKAFGGGDDNALGAGWGSEQGANSPMQDMAAKARLASRVLRDPKLRRIAQLTGRFQVVAAAAQRSKVEKHPDELVGITIGRDLGRVLPSQLVLRRHPVLRREFNRRFAEGRLLQYELSATRPEGRGPIIVLRDESGSMGGHSANGGLLAEAAAVELALLTIASKQKRDYRAIHFASRYQVEITDFPKARATPDDVLDLVLHNFGGGTDYETPLRAAMEAVDESMWKRADIIMLTDGVCGVSEEFLAEWHTLKTAKGFRCRSVLLGEGARASVIHNGYEAQVLKSFSDEVYTLDSLADKSERAGEALRASFSV